jgi:hypothetical protein
VFGNRVLKRIFGPRGDEVSGGWRKLHNEERHDLYSLPNIIRIMEPRLMRLGGGGVCRIHGIEVVKNSLWGKQEIKRSQGRKYKIKVEI